jgi:hypothetical protein
MKLNYGYISIYIRMNQPHQLVMNCDQIQQLEINTPIDKRTIRAEKRVAYPTPPQKIFDKYPVKRKKK